MEADRRMPHGGGPALLGMAAAALALLFATDTGRRFYLWSYLPAGLVMAPYMIPVDEKRRPPEMEELLGRHLTRGRIGATLGASEPRGGRFRGLRSHPRT